MQHLEMMELVLTALDYMKAGKRGQVQKEKLRDVRQIASTLLLNLKPSESPLFSIVIEDLLTALNFASEVQMSVLPDSMKDAIVKALLQIKEEVAALVFKDYSIDTFSFEEGDEIFKLMREVVKTQYLGG